MKTRTGFVSNSSSSSFIVAFDKTPQSVEEMQKILFGDKKFYDDPYDFPDKNGPWPANQVAKTVFDDLANPIFSNDVAKEISNGYFDGHPEHPPYSSMEDADARNKVYEQYKIDIDEAAEKLARKFLKKNPDKVLHVFNYSDEDGAYNCALEHGDLFTRLPHLVISKH